MPSKMIQLVRLSGWGILGAGLGTCLLALSAFAVPGFWLTDNMSFFTPQLLAMTFAALAASLGALCLKLFRHTWFKSGVAFLALGVSSLAVLAILRPMALDQALPPAPDGNNSPGFKIVSINLERLYLGDETLVSYLEGQQADVLVFQEAAWWLQQRWMGRAGIGRSIAGFGPYPEHDAFGEFGGIAVFSKYPISKQEFISVPGTPPDDPRAMRGILALDLQTEQGPLQLLAVHAASPRDATRWADRQAYLQILSDAAAQRTSGYSAPLVIIGDWNTSPWSAHFNHLLDETQLATAFPDGFPQPTRFFFDYRLRWLLGASVDHAAVSSALSLASVSLGPNVGTDHRPLVAEIEFLPHR